MSQTQSTEMLSDGWGDQIEWADTENWTSSPAPTEWNDTSNVWGTTPILGERYIVLFNDKTIFTGTVNEVENAESKYFTIVNDEKTLLFQLADNGTIETKTHDYDIADIARVKKYDMKLLDAPSPAQEKYEEINDIAYTVIDDNDRVYSKQELKEILISTLYSQYNADNISKPLSEIISYADILLDISGEQVMSKKTIGKWCIPIISNETRIYTEEKEIYDELKDLIENDKLIIDKNTKHDKNYIGLMKNLLHLADNIIHDENNTDLKVSDYEGKMYRNCIGANNCAGINGLYTFDELRNNKTMRIPTSFDRSTGNSNFLELKKPMPINVVGILTIPYHYFPYIYENLFNDNSMTLYEKCILQDLLKQTNIQKRNEFKNNTIISKQFTKEDHTYELNTFTIHTLNSKNKTELFSDIESIKPSVKEMLTNLDDKIRESIKSYLDITKLFVNYEINIDDLEKDYIYVNELITRNSNVAKKNTKIFALKKRKLVKKELDIEKRITLSKDIIFTMLNISRRNIFIKRFIDTFCVDSSTEDHWFVGIHDKKRLLCKHYSYLSGTAGETDFLIMKQRYQRLPPEDGNIYCKNCGEFICQEEFSHEDGFVNDMPSSSKEILQVDIDPFEKYDESDMNNIGLLKDISNGLGVTLNDEDIVLIIDTYTSLSEDIVANKRYNTLNITKTDEHPRVTEIKKTHKKDKATLQKMIKSFQIFLKVTNRIVVLVSLSLLVIGTSTPTYDNKYIREFKLFINEQPRSINKDFVNKITHVLKKISHTFGEKYDKIYTELFNEKKSYDVASVDEQICNTILFFSSSSFPKILTRFETYVSFQKSVEDVFIKYEWPMYKPLSNNKLIKEINKIIRDDKISVELLLKTYNVINVENITGVAGINEYNLQGELNIQNNDLINTAFQRLFNISVSLYGRTEKPNFFIDSNMEKFFNESNDDIKEVCLKGGYNDKTKTMGPVIFKNLRNKLIPAILKEVYESNDNNLSPCFTLKEHCNAYIHVNINNYDLSMMNVPSKRFYTHTKPDIFPSVNYSLITDDLKDKIFKTYAFDPANNIIKREMNTEYLGKFILDISHVATIEIEDNVKAYEKDIPRNELNFHKIVEYIHLKNPLRFNYIYLPQKITGDSVINYTQNAHINEYSMLLDGKDYSFDSEKFLQIIQILDDNIENIKDLQKDLTKIYIEIEDKNDEFLTYIAQNMNAMFNDNPSLRTKFQNIFFPGRASHIKIPEDTRQKLESYGPINYKNINEKNIEDIFRVLIEDDIFDLEYIKDIANDILYLLSNIVNSGFKNSYIPKSWKLSDTNKDWYKKYVDTRFFSHHRDIYKIKNASSFSEYFDPKLKLQFSELFIKIQKCVKYIEIQRNSYEGVLTKNIKSLWKHVYLNVIKELVMFSEEIKYRVNIEDDISDDSFEKFSLEIITHLFEKRYDTTWVYSNIDNLNGLLGIQKEREKQKLIHKLDGMTNDKRHATTELHTIGTKNYFKASEIENMEHIEDEKYKNDMEDESYINEMMNGDIISEQHFVIDDDTLNDNYDTGEQNDEDGGNLN